MSDTNWQLKEGDPFAPVGDYPVRLISEEETPVLTLSDAGKPILETLQGCTMPANFSFECINNFVHCEEPMYEDLQCLALGMSSRIEQLERDLAEARKDAMVAAQAQEPAAWIHSDGWACLSAEAFKNSPHWMTERWIKEGAMPLYAAPPAPASLSLVQAALEAAATECNREMMFPGGRQECYAHNGVDAAAKAIRAIDPQTIINEASK